MRHDPAVRARAARLFAAGVARAEAARRLGIAPSTASIWYRRWEERSLLTRPAVGRSGDLPKHVLRSLGLSLLRPPSAHDLPGEAWSTDLVVLWIERETGRRYHRGHVARLLRRCGWLVPPTSRSHAPRLRVPIPGPAPLHLQVRTPRDRAQA